MIRFSPTKDLPQEAGFYFIKTPNARYWQCMIRITGKAPFLQIGAVKALFKSDDVDITCGDLTALEWSEAMKLDEINYPEDEITRKVIDLMKGGAKLEAVKFVKDQKNWGLKEAKDYCDDIQKKYIQ